MNSYKVTDEICRLFDEAIVASKCMKIAVSDTCDREAAIAFGLIDMEKQREAWALIYKLYPELTNVHCDYLHPEKEVRLSKGEICTIE